MISPRLLIVLALFSMAACSRDRRPEPEPPSMISDVVNTPSSSTPEPPPPPERCPTDMVLVEGGYCPNPKQECLDWMEDPAKFPYARCRKFKETECNGTRQRLSFCIDREEYSKQGEELPTGDLSWTEAKATCESMGKRLCAEHEWAFACEGEESRPYPYGYERDPSVCNFEQKDLVEKGKMRDLRLPASANQQCMSPFGVHNMVGNIDEWVVLDKPHFSEKNNGRKMMSGLKGGWWGPLRNRCRPTTVDHDEFFHEIQTGFRCCK